MNVLVSDTSALVDLERGSLLDATFRLPFEFTVPDLLYQRELKNHGGDRLLGLGLRIAALDGEGVMQALDYRRQRPGCCITVSKPSSRTRDADCRSGRFAPDWSAMRRFWGSNDSPHEHRL